jgi:hypothetical protein
MAKKKKSPEKATGVGVLDLRHRGVTRLKISKHRINYSILSIINF